MGKESRIRKHRREFKKLATAAAAEQKTSIGDIAFTFYKNAKKSADKEKVQAIRWFTKEANADRFFI